MDKVIVIVDRKGHQVGDTFYESQNAAVEFLSKILPLHEKISIMKSVYIHLNGKTYNNWNKDEQANRLNDRGRLGHKYRVKYVDRELFRLRQLNELTLVEQYKVEKNNHRKNQIFNEFERRYRHFLKLQSNRLFTQIPVHYFAMDFEDCEIMALRAVELALGYFDENATSNKFQRGKFSLSYYIGCEVDAMISSYWWKYNMKQKRNIEYDLHDFNQQIDSEGEYNYSDIIEDHNNTEEKREMELLLRSLDEKLNEEERKIKDFLMSGTKESKIRSTLKISSGELEEKKQAIKKHMMALGLGI